MTVTEAPREEHVDEHVAADETEPTPATGLAALVGSGDPRTVGKLFVGTSLLFLLIVGTIGVLAGIDLVDPASAGIFGSSWIHQMVTLHQLGGLFLVVLPLLLGLALAVVPLQVGASTVAFPRASAAAYWTYLISGAILVAAYIGNGGPFGGDVDAVGLFVAALVALIVSLCTAAVSVATTVLAMRAPGMTLRRTPLFAWSVVVATSVWLLTLPVLAGLLVLYYVDVTYGGGTLFTTGSADLHDQIRWIFWQPALYTFAVPAVGIIADIVPVFTQRRHYRHTTALVLIGLLGAVSVGGWLLPFRLPTTGEASATPDSIPWLYDGPWVAVSLLAPVALLGLLGLWTLTILKGQLRLRGPLLLAQVAGLLLTLGVVGGVGTALEPLEVVGTTWMTGQAYAVLIGTLIAAVAGLAFWAPKLYGSLLSEGLTRMLAPVLLIGGLLVAVPYAVAGLLHQPWFLETLIDHGNTVDPQDVEIFNLLAAVGVAVVLAGGLLTGLGLVRARPAGADGTDDDPWGGHTLEWTTSSPPPVGNFAAVAEVTSEAPLYDARHARAADAEEAT